MSGKSGKALTALLGTCLSALPVLLACTSAEKTGTLQQGVLDLDTFELDGNATDDPQVPGDDWDTVVAGNGADIVNTGVIPDVKPVSIFWTGGSKDIHDITEWRHKDGSVPPKDEITNAYAAAYVANGDLSVYFGADRYAVNGASQMGFWLLQDEVGLNDDSTFSGEHVIGDVLVLADFNIGGKVSRIRIYEWVGSGGSEDTVDLIDEGEPATPGDDLFCLDGTTACGIVNGTDVPSPWAYVPKFGDPDIFPPGAFFEGGVNITALFGPDICFSSFLAETRASHEINAVTKDFVLGSLDTCRPPPEKCEIEVTKVCRVESKNPTWCEEDFTASFTVTITADCDLPKGTIITVVDDAGTADNPNDDVTVEIELDEDVDAGDPIDVSGFFQTNQNPPLYNVAHATVDTGEQEVTGSTEPTACTPLDRKD